MTTRTEPAEIAARYQRRLQQKDPNLYQLIRPDVCMTIQEKERALIRWIRSCGIQPVESKRVLDVGCGTGKTLAQFLRLGFEPANLVGSELLEARLEVARAHLPAALDLRLGDAMELDCPDQSFDIVTQSTVFSSVLDPTFQANLAQRMWRMTKPGGGVLWYDFTFNNPRNPDVAGVPLRRVKELFPDGSMRHWRLTLAPPISRLVTRVSPALYTVLNTLPMLRTHLLCWIEKPR
jgi:ubiquinone/menaquinone biosynthesis C-methylase UbiE